MVGAGKIWELLGVSEHLLPGSPMAMDTDRAQWDSLMEEGEAPPLGRLDLYTHKAQALQSCW